MALNSTSTVQEIQTEDINLAISIPEEVPYFKITQQTLANIVELYNYDTKLLHEDNSSCGGFLEIVKALKTDIHCGLKGDDLDDLCQRIKLFGSNHITQGERDYNPASKKSLIYELTFKALKDTSIILLLCCVMLSLAIEIKRNGPQEGISYGIFLFISIFVFVNIRFVCKYFKAKWLAKKHIPEGDLKVEVLRNGEVQQIEIYKIVVGDVLCLKKGDQVPVDGLFINGSETLKLDDNLDGERFEYQKNPSIFQGEKVVQGYCRMLVTAVGENTEIVKLTRASKMGPKKEISKLQIDIDNLNSNMQNTFLSLSLIVLVIQFFRCFVWYSGSDENPDPKGVKNTVEEIMTEGAKFIRKKGIPVNRLVSMICILVFSLRDGLALGIFICLASSSSKFMSHGVLVQEVEACTTISLVDTICLDTMNDLVFHPSKMAELWVGFEKIGDPIKSIPLQVLNTFREGVGLDMCFLEKFSLSFWAEQVLGVKIELVKEKCRVISIEDLDQEKNLLGFSILRNGGYKKGVHVHWRGVPNRVLSMCSHYYNIDGTMQTLDKETLARFDKVIQEFGSNSLQCLAFAYKKVCIQEKEKAELESYKASQHGLTLLGLIFLKNPYPDEIMGEIKNLKDLGVKVKLMVGDDVEKSRYVSINSGILKLDDEEMDTDGTLIEATDFQVFSKEEKMSIIEKFQVMANCTPCDRLEVVQCLRDKGDVVAAIVKSSRDSITLKEADLGVFWGENNNGKVNSDLLLSEMSFSKISSILKLGMCVLKNLQKFMQLQLTITISAFTINFFVVLLSDEVPLGPFELLWVNMVMDFVGAFALGEIEEMLQMNLVKRPRPCLITKSMWANIAIQSLYQVIAILILEFRGNIAMKMDQKVIQTMIFNCFMICQVFGMINARGIDQDRSFFKTMITKKKNLRFIVCVAVIFVLQIVAVETRSVIFNFGRLSLTHWCICTGIGVISLPIGWTVHWFCLIFEL